MASLSVLAGRTVAIIPVMKRKHVAFFSIFSLSYGCKCSASLHREVVVQRVIVAFPEHTHIDLLFLRKYNSETNLIRTEKATRGVADFPSTFIRFFPS